MCHRVGAPRERLQPHVEICNYCLMMGSYYLSQNALFGQFYPLDASCGRLTHFHERLNLCLTLLCWKFSVFWRVASALITGAFLGCVARREKTVLILSDMF